MTDVAVTIEHLSVDYGRHRALIDISAELPAGGFLAIVGPNGSGKSTLLKTLVGLVHPSRGTARLFDKPAHEAPAEQLGYVPQLKTLDRRFPALAVEVVATGLTRRWPLWLGCDVRQRALDALDRVGAAKLAKRTVAQLSGGELQRVYLARALVRNPRIVLLDEPATGIDAKGEHDFYHLLERYHEFTAATILMVTHDWSAAYHHASHVLLVSTRQIAFGPPKQALTDATMNEAFGHVGHSHATPWEATAHA